MYTVIGSVSSRAFRVLWALEELGADYTYQSAAPRSDDVLKHNPLGKIPVLLDGDAALNDSVAIMTYLADKHAGLTAPAGTPERARQDAMTFWLIDEFDALLWMGAKHGFIEPEERRVPAIRAYLKDAFGRNLDAFAEQMGDEFATGDSFSIADILAVHCLNWAIGAKFPLENDKVLEYGKRMRARPAFKRVRELAAK